MNYASLLTEKVNPRSKGLDRLTPSQIVKLMAHEDRQVLRAVSQAQHSIARAVALMVRSLRHGGRVVLVGAGTSGRLGVLEAAECPPTFGTSPALIQAVMAGGKPAVFRSKEGSEDSEKDAVRALRRIRVRAPDVVIGIAASGVTPFVRAALKSAKRQRAQTILLTCNPNSTAGHARIVIALRTGPEVLAGSTRLKAGTACKMVLNMMTTASMVQMGKVFGNRMVDLQPKSRKLVERGLRLIRELGQTSPQEARKIFKASRGHVKAAIVMARLGISFQQANRNLDKAKGFLRKAL